MLLILKKKWKNLRKKKKRGFKRKLKKKSKLYSKLKRKSVIKSDALNADQGSIYLVTAQRTRAEAFAINVDLQTIIIKTVIKKHIHWLTASIVVKKDILQENAQIIKKDCTEKEVRALAVVQSGIL